MRVCFFFGEAENTLYGVHHAPTATSRQKAILLCYPFGREYMRAHRALVRLSDQLAQAGFHTLRFDYSATGDSAGDDGESGLDDWLSDIHTAAQELRDISGIDKISLIGLRLGAALAAKAATSLSNIDSLILWDPIVCGVTYGEHLISLQKDFVQSPYHFSNPDLEPVDLTVTEELLGFKFGSKLRTSLPGLDISQLPGLDVRRIILISTDEQPEYRSLLENLSKLGIQTQHYHIQEQITWDDVTDIDLVLTAHEATNQIVQSLTESDA